MVMPTWAWSLKIIVNLPHIRGGIAFFQVGGGGHSLFSGQIRGAQSIFRWIKGVIYKKEKTNILVKRQYKLTPLNHKAKIFIIWKFLKNISQYLKKCCNLLEWHKKMQKCKIWSKNHQNYLKKLENVNKNVNK